MAARQFCRAAPLFSGEPFNAPVNQHEVNDQETLPPDQP